MSFKVSLQTKILSAVTLVVVVILAALSFLVINSQESLLISSQKNLSLSLVNNLDARIDSREQLNNPKMLQSEIEEVGEISPNITELSISLPQKANLRVVASNKKELMGSQSGQAGRAVFQEGELTTKTNETEDGKKFLEIIAPAHINNDRVGIFHLKFSLRGVQKIIAKTRTRFLYGILAAIPEFIIILYLLLRATVTAPIGKLREGAEAIESGNLEYRIMMDRRDEIGKLAQSFNKMAERLGEFYKKLDQMVKERTEELEQTKNNLRGKVDELRETKRKLQRSKRKMEQAQKSLKVRVRAKTKQLRELAEKREEIIRRRTKGLRKSRKALMNILEDVEQAKGEVEQERDKTTAILDNLPEGVIFFNGDGELSSINPQARAFFNLESKDVIGVEVNSLNQNNIQKLVDVIGEDLKEVHREELKLEEDLIVEVTSVHMAREEEIGTLVLVHDITREKRVQKMKTEFVSIAAHQLRTPLSGIKWTLKMLLDGDLGEINEEQREYIEETYEDNERMINLIKDLLNVSRIEEGRYVYEPREASLENLVREVLGNLQEEIEHQRVDVVFNKPEQATSVKVDVEKVGLAVKNLIDNAVRYSLERARVEVTIKQKQDKVLFSVEDNGIGIPEKQQDRIFTKFFRASNATRKKTEGSGLGLFITKNIIEAHQGEIWFESEQGEGTTFYFTLPNKEEFEPQQ